MVSRRFSWLLLAGLAVGCTDPENFPAIGDRVVSPIDVAVSQSGDHFYVLNSDLDRTYNKGSVLVLDRDGNKVKAIDVPRMGRSLTTAGTDMIVTIDYRDDRNREPMVILFDVTDSGNPVEVASFQVGCTPINSIIKPNYKYFFVACEGGPLFLGELKTPRSESTLTLVRNYGSTRRAMHLDTSRNLLFAFSTKLGEQDTSIKDAILLDAVSYAQTEEDTVLANEPANEVPDDFEKTRRERNNRSRRRPYQFIVYDIADQAERGFPYLDDPANRQVVDEHRWLYFNVGNFDGTPDNTAAETDPLNKYYRTNFWEAKSDPVDPNTFYLSHRGPPKAEGSPHANHIVRVRMTGNPRKRITLGGVERPDYTSNYLQFERVYGFAGVENNQFHYPGDFEVVDLTGQRLLVVNHFRDLVNWVRGDTYFSVVAKVMDEYYWQGETTANQDPLSSYYQVATAPDGRTLTGSFYGNAVILLDVTPGADIKELKRIE